jgi:AcrR family transcriptional regulator
MATFASGKASGGEAAAGGPPGTKPRRRPARRMSAEQRRAELLEAAVTEFARNGYHGTRTTDIAARAGVSQPYVYALFPDKRALFLACHDWTTRRIREALEEAGASLGADADAGRALGRCYQELSEEHPYEALFQLQAHASAAADPAIRAPVRRRFIELVELSEQLSGAPRELVLRTSAVSCSATPPSPSTSPRSTGPAPSRPRSAASLPVLPGRRG